MVTCKAEQPDDVLSAPCTGGGVHDEDVFESNAVTGAWATGDEVRESRVTRQQQT